MLNRVFFYPQSQDFDPGSVFHKRVKDRPRIFDLSGLWEALRTHPGHAPRHKPTIAANTAAICTAMKPLGSNKSLKLKFVEDRSMLKHRGTRLYRIAQFLKRGLGPYQTSWHHPSAFELLIRFETGRRCR